MHIGGKVLPANQTMVACPSPGAKLTRSFSRCVHNVHILQTGKFSENSLSRGDPLLFNPSIHTHPLNYSSQA
jgi:hypothetical protein